VLTSGGEFKVTGDSNGNLTGTGGFAMSGQSFNGSSDLAPINVGSVALYVQQKGSIIRDLFYSFDQDSYQSSDLTLLASHLFNDLQHQRLGACLYSRSALHGVRGVMACFLG
jgi:hypothetical protein